MGAPVVAMNWPTVAGRLSSSILSVLGMTDWIANDTDEYVAIAVRMAQDLEKLASTRAGLRARFDASVLGDTAAYVGIAEQTYLALWRDWCARQTLSTQTVEHVGEVDGPPSATRSLQLL